MSDMDKKQPFEIQLMQLGLSDKEARVYIAGLKIGAAPVQKIAEIAGVKRATTYVMIESLIARGLMSSYQKGKKTFFIAENPKTISTILEMERHELDTKQAILDGLMGELLAFSKGVGSHPEIRLFEGVEGLVVVHEDVINANADEILNIVAIDDARKLGTPPEHAEEFRKTLEKRGTKVRIIYTKSDGEIDLPGSLKKKWHLKKISTDLFPLHGEITVYKNKVAAFSYKGRIFATLIESKEIAQAVRVLFELAWQTK